MTIPLDRRVTLSVVILTAVGFATCFGLGYRRAAVEWENLHPTGPDNPLAAALLKNFPNSDPSAMIAAQQRFTLSDYLSQRVPNWPPPWPNVLCGAEWLGCVLIAGLCVIVLPKKHAPPNVATEPRASATGR